MQELSAGKFHNVTSDNLLRFDARSLDDRPPFLDFGLLLRGERLRRLFFARPDFLTHVGEPLAHRWIRQGVHECGMELGDNTLGRALARTKTMPKRRVKAGHPTSSIVGVSGVAAHRVLAIIA